jgi:hypothetical protein
MGAGLSEEREYQIVYRELHKIQRELDAAGVKSFYKAGNLRGFDTTGTKDFHIWVKRQNASNGECCLYPVATVQLEPSTHGERNVLYFGQLPWMPGPSFEADGKPLIINHFKA